MSLWNWITNTPSQEEQQANLDAQKAEFERRLAARQAEGTITEEQVARYRAGVESVQLEDVDQAAREGFVEGAKEGLQNVLEAPGKVVGAVGSGAGTILGGILKNIPLWVYGLGILYLLFMFWPQVLFLVRRLKGAR
jgi:soluble cytochrome b562